MGDEIIQNGSDKASTQEQGNKASSSTAEQDGISTTTNDVEMTCKNKDVDSPTETQKLETNDPHQNNGTNLDTLKNAVIVSTDDEKPSSSTSEPEAGGKKLKQGDSSEEDMSITTAADTSSSTEMEPCAEPEPEVELKVIFNKNPMPVNISLKKTVGDLKKILEKTTNVTPALMKVLVKGNAKDEVTLESLGLANGSKVLVIGTSLSDVMKVAQKPTEKELQEDEASSSNESKNWCSVPRHQKIISKGIPEDAMPGILDCHDELPPFPIHGMLSSKGSKVRLTFKLETDELWIGTKERTEKVPIGSIKAVVSQPITGLEHYHIMAIQLGPTEASRFFIYWVPSQYVVAIKNALSA